MTALQLSKDDTAVLRNSSMTKVKRYGWIITDKPGVLMDINKSDLFVDPAYQRDVRTKDAKVTAIAAAWSWIACGAIIVGMRNDEARMYVIDGQHRVLAAMKRADISTLPCIVFETDGPVQEAQGFLQANTYRKAMQYADQFKARVVAGDEMVIRVNDLVLQHGRVVASYSGPSTMGCARALLEAALLDWPVVERIYPIISELCAGRTISQQILVGLFYIERQESNGKSLLSKRWRDRLNKVGAEALETGARKMAGYAGANGARIWARGMVDVLNRGLRDDLLEIPQ